MWFVSVALCMSASRGTPCSCVRVAVSSRRRVRVCAKRAGQGLSWPLRVLLPSLSICRCLCFETCVKPQMCSLDVLQAPRAHKSAVLCPSSPACVQAVLQSVNV